MPRPLWVALVVTLSTALLWPSTAAAGEGGACDPRGSRTVEATRSVRVYKRGFDLFACAFRTGRPLRLGQPIRCDSPSSCGDGVEVLDLAGRWVLAKENLESIRQAGGEGWSAVWLIDTVVRRRVRIYVTYQATDAPPHNGADTVVGAVTASGRSAFVVDFFGPSRKHRQLRIAGPTLGSVLADSGLRIDPLSLAVSPRTAYWRHDGEARSVDLP